MKIWEETEISEEEVGRRVREWQGRIIDLLRDPANLKVVRQFCRLVLEMSAYANIYAASLVREVAYETMPEIWLRFQAEEAKDAAKEARRQARQRKAA